MPNDDSAPMTASFIGEVRVHINTLVKFDLPSDCTVGDVTGAAIQMALSRAAEGKGRVLFVDMSKVRKKKVPGGDGGPEMVEVREYRDNEGTVEVEVESRVELARITREKETEHE